MERQDILTLLENKEYDFLRTNPHLKDRILFLCLGGSHSYGTNIETSDIDIRGVVLDSEDDILGITNFEQFQNSTTDTTIYSLTKFIKLAADCNPNIIEMLFCKPEHYFYVSPLGQKLLNNRHLFLSKKAKYTFGGYAHAQLNRLENALVRNGAILTPKETEEHINRSVKQSIMSFIDRYNIKDHDIKTYVADDEEGIPRIFVDFNLQHCQLGNCREMIEQMTNILRDYTKTEGQRNKKKDDLHLNKHMMHLIRLYLMAIEIFETSDLHTYRDTDHDLLMNIRNGFYRRVDGGVKPEFYELLESLKIRLEEASKTSTLVDKVKRNEINLLLKEMIKEGVFNERFK
jgi:predicted nucleotidyltransferase